jgi:hypothetical protein
VFRLWGLEMLIGMQKGLWRTFGAGLAAFSSGNEEASAEKVELGASIHLAFDALELGDVAFRLPVGLGFADSGGNRLIVCLDPSCEGSEQAGGGVLKPGNQIGALCVPNHGLKAIEQRAGGDERRNGGFNGGDHHRVVF